MNRFPVLMYHSLKDGPLADAHPDKYSVSEKQFGANLKYLADRGYVVDSCKRLEERLSRNENLPERYCVLTVDDGHASGKEMSRMLLERGFSATFFATKNYCESRSDFMSADDLRSLIDSGMDVGAHGVTHLSLRHMSEDQMLDELGASKRWIESFAGAKPVAMSLPAGQGDERVIRAAMKTGFQMIGDSADTLARVSRLPSVLHRFVVLDGYGDERMSDILLGSPWYVAKRRLRSLALALPKRLLRSFDARRSAE